MNNPSTPFTDSPLSACADPYGYAGSIVLQAMPWCMKIAIRGDAGNENLLSAVETVTGMTLPLIPNTASHYDSSEPTASILWLGPDEWLYRVIPVFSTENTQDVEGVVHTFRQAMGAVHSAVVDVSDYYWLVELKGPRAFDVLEKGTPLDVRRSLASVGQCAQTRFGNAPVLLSRAASGETIVVQVRASFAQYLWQYLTQSALEFVA